MPKNSQSFFERLTGSSALHDSADYDEENNLEEKSIKIEEEKKKPEEKETPVENESSWLEDDEGGQLTVDMFQTSSEIFIEAMLAGVKSENLDISLAQDMVTIKGSRKKSKEVEEDNYYYSELYWGSFSRSILLPQEVDTDKAEASLKNGLLRIKLPKKNKSKSQKLEIKTD